LELGRYVGLGFLHGLLYGFLCGLLYRLLYGLLGLFYRLF
jgi:hypothetical protein